MLCVGKFPRHEVSEQNLLLSDVKFYLVQKSIIITFATIDGSCHDVSRNIGGEVFVVLLCRVESSSSMAGIRSVKEGYKNGGQAFFFRMAFVSG